MEKIWGACISWIAFNKEYTTKEGSLIQSGTCQVKKTIPGYGLHKGSGDRTFAQTVSFAKNFSVPPNVFVAFSQLDVVNEADNRINVYTNNVKSNSFDVVVGTWSDTKIWGCCVTWIAFDKSFSDSAGSSLKIQTGRQPFKKDTPGYNLSTGEGERSVKRRINFTKKFSANPAVVVALCQTDVLKNFDHRVSSTADNIGTSGFDVKVGTWNDSSIWSVSAVWLAFGNGEAVATTTTTSTSNSNSTPSSNNTEEENPSKKQKTETTTSTDTPSTSSVKEEDKECKVCFDNQINCVLVPCGHLCVCQDCSKLLTKHAYSAKCPICKQDIKSVVKTYLS